MIRQITWGFLALVACGSPRAFAGTEELFRGAEWEKVSDRDGIVVSRWERPGADLFAFKAEAVVDSPIAKVANVILDTDRQKEWVPNLGEARRVREISPTSRVQYLHIETPFVVKDRDFVVKGQAEYKPEEPSLFLHFASTEDEAAPPTNKVRGEIHASSYRLEPIEGGAKTRVTLLVNVDPKGTVPRWIVNLFQKSFPRQTLKALRKQASRDDVGEHPAVKAAFARVALPAGAVSLAAPADEPVTR